MSSHTINAEHKADKIITWQLTSGIFQASLFNPQIDGLVQERCNSIANTLDLHLSCTNPSKWHPISCLHGQGMRHLLLAHWRTFIARYWKSTVYHTVFYIWFFLLTWGLIGKVWCLQDIASDTFYIINIQSSWNTYWNKSYTFLYAKVNDFITFLKFCTLECVVKWDFIVTL